MNEPTQYTAGQVVDVTIRDAQVVRVVDGWLILDVGAGDASVGVPMPDGALPDNITVKHVVPAEGEPQPGDVWRDPNGTLWFARSWYPDVDAFDVDAPGRHRFAEVAERQGQPDGPVVVLTSGYGGPCGLEDDTDPHEVSRKYGPLTLVYREADGSAVSS